MTCACAALANAVAAETIAAHRPISFESFAWDIVAATVQVLRLSPILSCRPRRWRSTARRPSDYSRDRQEPPARPRRSWRPPSGVAGFVRRRRTRLGRSIPWSSRRSYALRTSPWQSGVRDAGRRVACMSAPVLRGETQSRKHHLAWLGQQRLRLALVGVVERFGTWQPIYELALVDDLRVGSACERGRSRDNR